MSIYKESMNQYNVLNRYNCEVDGLVMTVYQYKKRYKRHNMTI